MYMGHWVKSELFQNLSIQTTKENIQTQNKKKISVLEDEDSFFKVHKVIS